MFRHLGPEPGPQSIRQFIVRFQDHLVLGMDQGRLTATTKQGHSVDLNHFHAIVEQAGGWTRQSYPRIAEDLRKRSIRSTTGIDRFVDLTLPRLPASRVDAVQGGLEDLRDLIVYAWEVWPYLPANPPPESITSADQVYLKAQRWLGVGAECAWKVGGGDGAGVVVCLCDIAISAHEDLPAPIQIFGTPPTNAFGSSIEHANSAMGVIAAIKDNGKGGTGISPKAEIWFATTNGYVDVYRPNDPTGWKRFDTEGLDCVYHAMTDGGIVVLEMMAAKTDPNAVTVIAPAEMNPHLRAWIREAALNRGIVTVVPAGTSLQPFDLDTIESPCIVPETSPEEYLWKRVWTLPESHAEHSWGVMVGGGDPKTHEAVNITNYGSRVDCQGWGAGVATTGGPGLSDYINDFNGTSSAAAMIGGVAACLQGAYKSAYGQPLPPNVLRHLLSDSSLGAVQPAPDAIARHIGPLPDLAAMLRRKRILGDVYIRDNLNDTGARPQKILDFLSPDIIVGRAGRWNDGDLSFWLEHLDDDLLCEFASGSLYEVFVRVHNRSMNPGEVKVHAYWADAGLFLEPSAWNEIGTSGNTTVPPYDNKIVSVGWWQPTKPDKEICLIATVDSDCDPMWPGWKTSPFLDYKVFLLRSNNVAFRNLQCMNLRPVQTQARFFFQLVGIPRMEDSIQDQGFFRLVIEGRLPPGTVITLRPGEPLYGEGSGAMGPNPEPPYQVVAPAPLILDGIRLPAGARIPMGLEVTLPDDAPAKDYYLHADQFHDDDFIGRGNFLIRYGQSA